MSGSEQVIHATAVAIDGRGVLLLGRSGAGKSDLAIRLIDRGAELIGDDRVALIGHADAATIRALPTLAGAIELRGVGIVTMPHRAEAPLALAVDLDGEVERCPLDHGRITIAGVMVAGLRLVAFEASAPIKIEQALMRRQGDEVDS